MVDVQSSFEHHLLQIAVAKWITEVSSYAEQNDISLEMTPFERGGGVHKIGFSQFSEYRRVYCIFAIFATQPYIYFLSNTANKVLEESDRASRVRKDDIESYQYPFLHHVLSLNDVLIAASLLPRSIPELSITWLHDFQLKESPIRITGEKRLATGKSVSED